MSAYVKVGRLDDDMPVLEHLAFGVQIWVKVKTRKEHRCAICGPIHAVGTTMFRPITNGTNRWERICLSCMSEVVERG